MKTTVEFDEEMMTGINVTPLVDVCLVLVIIFMVTAPLLSRPVFDVALPVAKTHEGEEKDKVTISLAPDNRMAVESKEFKNVEDLSKELAVKLYISESKLVIIRADRGASHGRLVDLMERAKEAGAQSINIATEQKK